ncbi:MAG: class I SAM-dependent methyltransferase [Actinomycetota bacterium]|nr:class I SAM-dependent methyltransferase [Actinomycetota bacterium]
MLNDIVINNRKRIIECGGGISTLYMARLLSTKGGHLFTIEEDPEWSEILGTMLVEHDLHDQVSIIVAPMAPTQLGVNGMPWYSSDKLEHLLDGPPIDLLVVDGPQATEHRTRMARYPALPFFAPNLSEDCTVVLDDIGRQGEQDVLLRWEHEHGRRFSRRHFRGGIAISIPGGLSV